MRKRRFRHRSTNVGDGGGKKEEREGRHLLEIVASPKPASFQPLFFTVTAFAVEEEETRMKKRLKEGKSA